MPLEKHFEPQVPQGGRLPAFDAPADPSRLPASMPIRTACRIVRQMVAELILLFGDRLMLRRDRRRCACHARQIAMYVCHVSLQIPMRDIGHAFGRDRTTVGHACHVVEDRRDDAAFDDFVSAIERIATAVFGLSEVLSHD